MSFLENSGASMEETGRGNGNGATSDILFSVVADARAANARTGATDQVADKGAGQQREVVQLISERALRFAALVSESNAQPERRAQNERTLDGLLASADRETDAALLRRETRLRATGGDTALTDFAKANRDLTRAHWATGDRNTWGTALAYIDSLQRGRAAAPEVAAAMNQHPELKSAAERFAQIARNPALRAGQDIVAQARREAADSINLRRTYAEMLAGTGRSGKALSLIVQAKELERQFAAP